MSKLLWSMWIVGFLIGIFSCIYQYIVLGLVGISMMLGAMLIEIYKDAKRNER